MRDGADMVNRQCPVSQTGITPEGSGSQPSRYSRVPHVHTKDVTRCFSRWINLPRFPRLRGHFGVHSGTRERRSGVAGELEQ